MRVLLVQGANMASLGRRQPELYGTTTARELDALVRRHARSRRVDLQIFYASREGDAVSAIQVAARSGIDGILFNPAGFLHSGHGLADCLRSVGVPAIEVHVTNIEKRGRRSVTASVAAGVVAGFGVDSYRLAFDALLSQLVGQVPVVRVVGA